MANNYLFLPTTKAIYKSVTKTYSKKGNKSCIYDFHQNVFQFTQGDQSLVSNYSTLCNLWEEIDFYKIFKAQCIEDATLYN